MQLQVIEGTPRKLPIVQASHGSTYIQTMGSLAEALDIGPMTPANKERLGQSFSVHSRDGMEAETWYGCSGVDEVLRRCSEGWAEGGERLARMGNELSVNAPSEIRRVRVRADQGDEYDMHRANSGALDRAWSRTARRSRRSSKTRTVRLVLQAGASHRVTAEELFWRGAATLVAADALAAAGYQVEVFAIYCSFKVTDDKTTAHQSALLIKSSDRPLDIGRVAAVICLSGFFRSVMFAHRCAIPKKVANNFGYSYEPALADLAHHGIDDAHIVPSEKIGTKDGALAWLKEISTQFE